MAVEVVQPGERHGGRVLETLAVARGPGERADVDVGAEPAPSGPEVGAGAGAGQGALRAAVEAAAEGDHPRAAGRVDGEPEGALHGLGARGGEREGVDPRGAGLGQPRGQLRRGGVREDAAGVQEPVELVAGGGHDAGVVVAEVGRRDPRGAVHDPSAVGRLDPDPPGPHGPETRGRGRVHGATSSHAAPGLVSSSSSSDGGSGSGETDERLARALRRAAAKSSQDGGNSHGGSDSANTGRAVGPGRRALRARGEMCGIGCLLALRPVGRVDAASLGVAGAPG